MLELSWFQQSPGKYFSCLATHTMWPAASQFHSMYFHSLRLISAAASVKVEWESKTLWWIYKGNIHPCKCSFITLSGLQFHLSLLWSPHKEMAGGINVPHTAARILLRTAEHLSADTMKLNWTHKHNEQFDVSVKNKLMMLYCAHMTGLNDIYKVYKSLHIYSIAQSL